MRLDGHFLDLYIHKIRIIVFWFDLALLLFSFVHFLLTESIAAKRINAFKYVEANDEIEFGMIFLMILSRHASNSLPRFLVLKTPV